MHGSHGLKQKGANKNNTFAPKELIIYKRKKGKCTNFRNKDFKEETRTSRKKQPYCIVSKYFPTNDLLSPKEKW